MKTMREFWNAIITEEVISDEMREFAEKQIVQMDATNEKRKAKAAEKAKEKEPRIRMVADMLTDEPKTATMIAVELTEAEGAEVKVQTASALLRKAVEKGWANVQDIKVPKKGTQKGYTARQPNHSLPNFEGYESSPLFHTQNTKIFRQKAEKP